MRGLRGEGVRQRQGPTRAAAAARAQAARMSMVERVGARALSAQAQRAVERLTPANIEMLQRTPEGRAALQSLMSDGGRLRTSALDGGDLARIFSPSKAFAQLAPALLERGGDSQVVAEMQRLMASTLASRPFSSVADLDSAATPSPRASTSTRTLRTGALTSMDSPTFVATGLEPKSADARQAVAAMRQIDASTLETAGVAAVAATAEAASRALASIDLDTLRSLGMRSVDAIADAAQALRETSRVLDENDVQAVEAAAQALAGVNMDALSRGGLAAAMAAAEQAQVAMAAMAGTTEGNTQYQSLSASLQQASVQLADVEREALAMRRAEASVQAAQAQTQSTQALASLQTRGARLSATQLTSLQAALAQLDSDEQRAALKAAVSPTASTQALQLSGQPGDAFERMSLALKATSQEQQAGAALSLRQTPGLSTASTLAMASGVQPLEAVLDVARRASVGHAAAMSERFTPQVTQTERFKALTDESTSRPTMRMASRLDAMDGNGLVRMTMTPAALASVVANAGPQRGGVGADGVQATVAGRADAAFTEVMMRGAAEPAALSAMLRERLPELAMPSDAASVRELGTALQAVREASETLRQRRQQSAVASRTERGFFESLVPSGFASDAPARMMREAFVPNAQQQVLAGVEALSASGEGLERTLETRLASVVSAATRGADAMTRQTVRPSSEPQVAQAVAALQARAQGRTLQGERASTARGSSAAEAQVAGTRGFQMVSPTTLSGLLRRVAASERFQTLSMSEEARAQAAAPSTMRRREMSTADDRVRSVVTMPSVEEQARVVQRASAGSINMAGMLQDMARAQQAGGADEEQQAAGNMGMGLTLSRGLPTSLSAGDALVNTMEQRGQDLRQAGPERFLTMSMSEEVRSQAESSERTRNMVTPQRRIVSQSSAELMGARDNATVINSVDTPSVADMEAHAARVERRIERAQAQTVERVRDEVQAQVQEQVQTQVTREIQQRQALTGGGVMMPSLGQGGLRGLGEGLMSAMMQVRGAQNQEMLHRIDGLLNKAQQIGDRNSKVLASQTSSMSVVGTEQVSSTSSADGALSTGGQFVQGVSVEKLRDMLKQVGAKPVQGMKSDAAPSRQLVNPFQMAAMQQAPSVQAEAPLFAGSRGSSSGGSSSSSGSDADKGSEQDFEMPSYEQLVILSEQVYELILEQLEVQYEILKGATGYE